MKALTVSGDLMLLIRVQRLIEILLFPVSGDPLWQLTLPLGEEAVGFGPLIIVIWP